MSRKYRIESDGESSNWLDGRELLSLVQNGKIGPQTRIRVSDQDRVVPASKIQGLFTSPARQNPEPADHKEKSPLRPIVIGSAIAICLLVAGLTIWITFVDPWWEEGATEADTGPDSIAATPVTFDHPRDAAGDANPTSEPTEDSDRTPPPVVETNARPSPSFAPIDESWTQLPLDFRGHDPKMLYEAVLARLDLARVKDEFDTEAQHQQKIRAAMSGPLIDTWRVTDFVAIPIADNSDDFRELRYDAERQRYASITDGLDIEIEVSRKAGASYSGQNAFGVEVEIQVAYVHDLRITTQNASDFDPVRVPMDAITARSLSDSIAVLAIGRLDFPFLLPTEIAHHEPTIQIPLELTTSTDVMLLRVTELWVINTSSGEIIQRMTTWRGDPSRTLKRVLAGLRASDYTTGEVAGRLFEERNRIFASIDIEWLLDDLHLVFQWHDDGFVLSEGTRTDSQGVVRLVPEYGYYERDKAPPEIKRIVESPALAPMDD